MGAAAHALPRQGRPKSRPAPEWQSDELPRLTGRFTQIPNTYFTVLPGKCEGFEHSLVGLILYRTLGAKGRPAWTRLTNEEIAEALIITSEGAQQLTERAVKKGLLVRRKDGRRHTL